MSVAAVAASAGAAVAHHARDSYDLARWITLEGTVREVHLASPHSWIFVDVPTPSRAPVAWVLEATSARGLQRSGIASGDVRAGDVISARCHPARRGRATCQLGYVTPLHGDAARGHGVEKRWD